MKDARTVHRTVGVALGLIEALRGGREAILSLALDVAELYAKRRREPAASQAV